MRNSIFVRGCVVSLRCAAFATAIAACAPVAAYAQGAAPVKPAPQAPAAKPQPPGDLKEPSSELPSARSIIDKHVEAIGGRAAILSHSSSHATGTMTIAGAGISGALDIYNAKPAKSMLKMTLPGIGEFMEGFDGTRGWGINPVMGPTLATGTELDQKRFDADFYSDLHDDSRYTSMKTVEKTVFDGRPCYKVSLVKKIGGEDFEFYDVATGLKAGAIGARETQMGSMSVTVIQTDYKKFAGMLVPTTIKQAVSGVEQLITITSIEFDTVPPSTFDMPEKIKALVK
jgi:hypothetical protein